MWALFYWGEKMKGKLYCDKCEKFVEYEVIKKREVYDVKNSDEVEIISNIAKCAICGNELFHIELEDDNLRRAYSKAKRT